MCSLACINDLYFRLHPIKKNSTGGFQMFHFTTLLQFNFHFFSWADYDPKSWGNVNEIYIKIQTYWGDTYPR